MMLHTKNNNSVILCSITLCKHRKEQTVAAGVNSEETLHTPCTLYTCHQTLPTAHYTLNTIHYTLYITH